MIILRLLPVSSNSWIGVTVLFPVPTSPMITKWSEKSILSSMLNIGRSGLFFCAAVFGGGVTTSSWAGSAESSTSESRAIA